MKTCTPRASLLAALAATAVGCTPQLPLPAGLSLETAPDGGISVVMGSGGPDGGLTVTAEPDAPLDAVPAVLRLHASLPGQALDPTRLALVEGTMDTRELHEIESGDVSKALETRLVPILAWSEGEGEALAAEAPLTAGATYTMVLADLPATQVTKVAVGPGAPILPRVWPPAGASSTVGFAVWCGVEPVPRVDAAVTLAPGALAGRIRRGAVPAGAGERCLRFEADDGVTQTGGAAVPPASVPAADEPRVVIALDPRPLQVDAPALPAPAPTCVPGEVVFGPGCARLADDRLYGRSATVPLLWAIAGAGADAVIPAAAGDPFVVAGLPPSTEITLDVAAVDTRGGVWRGLFVATTRPPAPHVEINEVMAHPLGPEPQEEWVELLNDGSAPAVLDGYTLLVGGHPTPLPPATLLPGAFALVVRDDFVASGGPDVPPAPGALLLQVQHIGASGLSDDGVVISLLDGDGKTVSSFPAKPKPKQGSSVARLTPSSPDALPTSFALAVPSPGLPNTW